MTSKFIKNFILAIGFCSIWALNSFAENYLTLREFAAIYRCEDLLVSDQIEHSWPTVNNTEMRADLDPDSGRGWTELDIRGVFPEGFLQRLTTVLSKGLTDSQKSQPEWQNEGFSILRLDPNLRHLSDGDRAYLEQVLGKADIKTLLNYGLYVEDLVLSSLPRWERKNVYAGGMFIRIEAGVDGREARNTEIHVDGSNPNAKFP